MGIRRYLQWVEIHPDGYENPQQFELTGRNLKRAGSEKLFLDFKKQEGKDKLSKAGTYIKTGSVRIIDFKDHSDEKGMIIYDSSS